MKVLFVRHAMPHLDPAVSARQWRLGPDGHAAARKLHLPTGAAAGSGAPAEADAFVGAAEFIGAAAFAGAGVFVVASDEPKAADTIRSATGIRDVPSDPGFAEVHRPDGWDPHHRDRARAWVDGATHDGWETHDRVISRFDAALHRHTTRAAAPTPGAPTPGAAAPTPGASTPAARSCAGGTSARAGLLSGREAARTPATDPPAVAPILIVGTHGMALTCWLNSRGLLSTPPGVFWAALPFPAVIPVDL